LPAALMTTPAAVGVTVADVEVIVASWSQSFVTVQVTVHPLPVVLHATTPVTTLSCALAGRAKPTATMPMARAAATMPLDVFHRGDRRIACRARVKMDR